MSLKVLYSDKGDYLAELRFLLPEDEEDKSQSEDEEEQKEDLIEGEEEKVHTEENIKSKVILLSNLHYLD